LKNIDPAILREITLISARAELTAAQAHVHALEAVVKVVEKAQVESRKA
jgi:phage terminase Nu1 subunit (DNA packaging protein)